MAAMATMVTRFRNCGLVKQNCSFLIFFVLIVLFRCVGADEKGTFTYKYLDNEGKILKLRCAGVCPPDYEYTSTLIYNLTSLQVMATWKFGRGATISKPSLQQISYYANECLTTEDHCDKELLITNVGIIDKADIACNFSCTEKLNVSPYRTTSLLTIIRNDQSEQASCISTTTFAILIIVISVLFLVAVFFMSSWIRAWRQVRSKTLDKTPSQSWEAQYQYGDCSTADSFSISPSTMSVRRPFEAKHPTINGSVRRLNTGDDGSMTASRRGNNLPPPPSPPKLYWETQPIYSQQTSGCSMSIAYLQPQDAIKPDFSEDGDVTSDNTDNQHGYSQVAGQRNKKPQEPFYSSVLVRSVDV